MFSPNEDFKAIISRALSCAVKSIKPIATGWTNIVIEATTPDGEEYFFRFPRSEFWSKILLKDVRFARFVKGKTSFETPDIVLCYDEGRPFSRHKKIRGWCFAERLGHLSREAIATAAAGMAKFVREIGMLDIKELTEKEPEFALMTCAEFASNLADLHFEDKTYRERFPIFQPASKQEEKLCHGDFGVRNVLVDDRGNVVGVIDFAFATTGDNKYVDLARVIGQSPPELEPVLVEAFEKEMGKLDRDRLYKSVDTWRYIDSQYINFMRKHQPEITV